MKSSSYIATRLLPILLLLMCFSLHAKKTYTVEVTVTDEVTKLAYPGCIVKLTEGETEWIDTTDLNGIAHFSSIRSKEIVVVVTSATDEFKRGEKGRNEQKTRSCSHVD
jgi:cytoskeletal protein RodZ